MTITTLPDTWPFPSQSEDAATDQRAESGDSSKLAASGDSSIAISAAPNCKAKAGKNGCIALAYWVSDEKRFRMAVGYVGENGIEADTWYRAENGKLIAA